MAAQPYEADLDGVPTCASAQSTWLMADTLAFVQFPHPGSEVAAKDDQLGWNRGDHARKFLLGTGTYLDGDEAVEGKITFWGEWEPQSRVVRRYRPASRYGPSALHEPYWQVPTFRRGLQNTDPLVFGERFLYSNCRQRRNQKLLRLAPGSLTAFGSKLGGGFVLDTLIVVGGSGRWFQADHVEHLAPPEWVSDVVFDRLGRAHPSDRFRLYEGTRWDDPGTAIYSFVPCMPYGPDGAPFERPVLDLGSRWISPNLAMGAKVTPADASELAGLWQDIVRQVIDRSGLRLAVEINQPERRMADARAEAS